MNKKAKLAARQGFTLIELLIVIAIIGILAVAFLPALLDAPAKGRDTQRVADVQKLQTFLVTENLAGETLPVTAPGCIDPDEIAADAIGLLIKDSISDFGGVFPNDPQDGNNASGGGACDGHYGYVNYSVGDYTAGVYAQVEDDDNGNIDCVDARLDNANPVLGDTGTCYLALIQ
jgi:prepilin-type N-terminal cleavage/methylation domain-containing protein